MASPDQVRQYLAYWFQLGKRVVLPGGRPSLLPQPVIQGDRYSPAFEACWQQLQQPDAQEAYLEGTSQTLAELFSSAWEIEPCARCEMPVPILNLGVQSPQCPCHDLPHWPDTELPAPRSPISSRDRLGKIRRRLIQESRPNPEQSSLS